MKPLLALYAVILTIILNACASNMASNAQSSESGTLTESHTHCFVQSVVEPGCTNDGYIINTCECGEIFFSEEKASLGHVWINANCSEPKVCSSCGVTEGAANGHSWINATCTSPKICSTCNTTEGTASGHSWIDATCTSPKECRLCGNTQGNPNGHRWRTSGSCYSCNTTNTEYTQEYNKLTEQYSSTIADLDNQIAALYESISASYEKIETLEQNIATLKRTESSFIYQQQQYYISRGMNSYDCLFYAKQDWEEHYSYYYNKYYDEILQEYTKISQYSASINSIEHQKRLVQTQYENDISLLRKNILGI